MRIKNVKELVLFKNYKERFERSLHLCYTLSFHENVTTEYQKVHPILQFNSYLKFVLVRRSQSRRRQRGSVAEDFHERKIGQNLKKHEKYKIVQ